MICTTSSSSGLCKSDFPCIPFFRTAFELVRSKVRDEVCVPDWGSQRRLIQSVPEIWLALFGDNRRRAVWRLPAPIRAEVKTSHFQHLLCTRKPMRIADSPQDLSGQIRGPNPGTLKRYIYSGNSRQASSNLSSTDLMVCRSCFRLSTMTWASKDAASPIVRPIEPTAALQIAPTLRSFYKVVLPGATVR